MSKHTPGPWYVTSQDDYPTGCVSSSPMGNDIALTWSEERAKEDARLIAKAPSMHALLSELADYLDVPESAAGGDDTARAYCKRIRELLA